MSTAPGVGDARVEIRSVESPGCVLTVLLTDRGGACADLRIRVQHVLGSDHEHRVLAEFDAGFHVDDRPAVEKSLVNPAGREYAEIWGETIHSNRHLRVFSIVLGVLLLFVNIAVVRLSSVEPPRPIVVRVDAVGRAEALAYETVEAQADPRDPTTKYFLNRFLHDHFGRRRATAQEYWPRSLRFLTTDLANAAFTASNEEIAMLAAGITGEELRVENVVLRNQANPVEPHGAVADFVLVRTRQEREVSREAWTATMQFVFMPSYRPTWSSSTRWASRSHTSKPTEHSSPRRHDYSFART